MADFNFGEVILNAIIQQETLKQRRKEQEEALIQRREEQRAEADYRNRMFTSQEEQRITTAKHQSDVLKIQEEEARANVIHRQAMLTAQQQPYVPGETWAQRANRQGINLPKDFFEPNTPVSDYDWEAFLKYRGQDLDRGIKNLQYSALSAAQRNVNRAEGSIQLESLIDSIAGSNILPAPSATDEQISMLYAPEFIRVGTIPMVPNWATAYRRVIKNPEYSQVLPSNVQADLSALGSYLKTIPVRKKDKSGKVTIEQVPLKGGLLEYAMAQVAYAKSQGIPVSPQTKADLSRMANDIRRFRKGYYGGHSQRINSLLDYADWLSEYLTGGNYDKGVQDMTRSDLALRNAKMLEQQRQENRMILRQEYP